ncbi:MAG TPA: hypothetical protein VFJ70_19835 [Burkholderiales bacterium]|nr:hypothetical protein [Burkholderiales bacterium]
MPALVFARRFWVQMVRSGLHAAVVLTVSIALLLVFVIWSLPQFFDAEK